MCCAFDSIMQVLKSADAALVAYSMPLYSCSCVQVAKWLASTQVLQQQLIRFSVSMKTAVTIDLVAVTQRHDSGCCQKQKLQQLVCLTNFQAYVATCLNSCSSAVCLQLFSALYCRRCYSLRFCYGSPFDYSVQCCCCCGVGWLCRFGRCACMCWLLWL